jgi:hypothetical protein
MQRKERRGDMTKADNRLSHPTHECDLGCDLESADNVVRSFLPLQQTDSSEILSWGLLLLTDGNPRQGERL